MSALAMTMAMLATHAGEVQPRPAPPPVQYVPMPPLPVPMVVPPPPPLPVPPGPPPPHPVAVPPRIIRAPQTCLVYAHEEQYDFGPCFNGGDYPLPAYSAREQGVASVRVQLGADGRPRACEVAVSSGSVALNRATCDLLRARILAATNDEGRGVTGAIISGDVRWTLPAGPPRDDRPDLLTYFSMDDYPASALRNEEQGIVEARLDVAVTGRVGNCTVTASSGSAALDTATCRIVRSRVRYRPAVNGRRPVPGVTHIRVTWQLPDE